MVGQLLKNARDFVEQVYYPDLLAVAPYYLDWAGIGGGLENYLCYGDLPTQGFAAVDSFKFPAAPFSDATSRRCFPSTRGTPRPASRNSSTAPGTSTTAGPRPAAAIPGSARPT